MHHNAAYKYSVYGEKNIIIIISDNVTAGPDEGVMEHVPESIEM